jgi:AcrR family transcriptional regulator
VFRRKGVSAPLEEIAREAGVAIGTLYNRFPSRGELVDAALAPLVAEVIEVAERAAAAEDPWAAFETLMTDTCALFARDRGYADVYRSRVPDTPVIDAAQRRLGELKAAVLTRAKSAGVLRGDVAGADMAILIWGVIATMDATRDAAPDAWRRHLALLLDGLRPGAARSLPVPPLTLGQLRSITPP